MNLKTSETKRGPARAESAVAVLLCDLIDYAGLFPPASLAMAPAVANYQAYLCSEYGWILGRFVLPVARLDEFARALAEAPAQPSIGQPAIGQPATAGPGTSWELSVLPGVDISGDVARIHEFNHRFAASHLPARAEIKSIEMRITSPEGIHRLARMIPAELETYFEIPFSGNERECIAAVADCGRRAKIRTGGETADKFPAPESVIEFIRLCAAANVPFKATAGLHHPLRSVHHFTYQPDSPSGIMHGFLNVFIASAFLRTGMERGFALQLLNERSTQAFHFDSGGVIWREHRVGLQDVAAARQHFSISFGSCSFTEPIDDLRSLHLL
ncbi:MAG: hypothetical protein WA172_05125 [Terriglobales bacterium]